MRHEVHLGTRKDVEDERFICWIPPPISKPASFLFFVSNRDAYMSYKYEHATITCACTGSMICS
jgi:hypothetical protein